MTSTTGAHAAGAEPLSSRRTATHSPWWLLGPIAWGVLLFGAVYPWAYGPLLIATAAIGAYGWFTAPEADREPARSVALGVGVIVVVAIAQLVPIPGDLLARISPATDRALARYDVAYAVARAGGATPAHPLSIAPAATLRGLVFAACFGAWLLGGTALVPRLPLGRLLAGLTGLGLLVALLGLVQRATFNERIYWVWIPMNVASNAFGPFVNRNHFAGWMLLCISLAAGYLCALIAAENPRDWRTPRAAAAALSTRRVSRIVFVAGALGVMVLSVVWTLSRSGIAALFGAAAIAALAARAPDGARVRRRGPARLALAVVPIALAGAVVWRGIGDVAEWYGRTDTLMWRVHLWTDTLPILRDFWWSGTGLNTYGVSTLLYPMSDAVWHAAEAHSDYVQVASEGGVMLVAAAVFTIVLLVRGIRRACARPQPSTVYWIRRGAVMGLLALAIQELTDFSLQMPGTAALFLVCAAIALHRPSGGFGQAAGRDMRARSPEFPS